MKTMIKTFCFVIICAFCLIAKAGDVPEAPSNVEFGVFDSVKTDLEMFWDQSPSDDVWGYVVYYSTDGGINWKCGGYTWSEADGRYAKGIGKYAIYLYKLAAFNESGNSAWVYFPEWTYSEYSKPGEIKFGDYDEKKQTLYYSWEASKSIEFQCYVCEYSTDGGKTWKEACKVYNRTGRTASKVKKGTLFRTCTQDKDGFRSKWVEAVFN